MTYQLHDLSVIVEVTVSQTEFLLHRALLLKPQQWFDLTANRLFKTERNLVAKSEYESMIER
ncbi:MAG: hypothetical protein GQ532_14065 [Methylomarinum sp.]|nr:hypothetical protein [Methylomarinum sp.]